MTPPTNWAGLKLDDQAWPTGSARLGYGGDGEITTLSFGPDPNFKHLTTWFRHAFALASPGGFDTLRLRLQRDDGAVVYLNGVEIFRNNMQAGLVSPNSLAVAGVSGAEETVFLEASASPVLLRAGTNVVAVEVHQQTINSSDLGFDLELAGLKGTNLTEGVYLTSPAQNARFNMPAQIALEAYAVAVAGITGVEFFAGGTSLGQATSPPYALTWHNPPEGTHTLTAQATRSGGGLLVSPPLQVTVGLAPAPIVAVQDALVTAGSFWRYLDDGSDQGSAWREPGYNDSAWLTGPARLGFGLDGETTVLRGGIATTYFRQEFQVDNPEWLNSLVLRVQRDDGVVVHLNGWEIFRDNMPSGTPLASTLALATMNSLDEQQFLELLIPTAGSGLRSGTNLLAVEVHQASVDSSDLGFDLDLTGLGSTDRRVFLGSPADQTTFQYPATIPLEAFAWAGSAATIRKVEFFAENTKLGEVTAPPYQLVWSGANVGTYAVTVVATDDRNQRMVSAPVTLSVGFLPVVTQLVPAGAVWKYLDDGSNQGTAWAQPGYNDAGWLLRPGSVGIRRRRRRNDGELWAERHEQVHHHLFPPYVPGSCGHADHEPDHPSATRRRGGGLAERDANLPEQHAGRFHRLHDPGVQRGQRRRRTELVRRRDSGQQSSCGRQPAGGGSAPECGQQLGSGL